MKVVNICDNRILKMSVVWSVNNHTYKKKAVIIDISYYRYQLYL